MNYRNGVIERVTSHETGWHTAEYEIAAAPGRLRRVLHRRPEIGLMRCTQRPPRAGLFGASTFRRACPG
jgi:hypothetical protein